MQLVCLDGKCYLASFVRQYCWNTFNVTKLQSFFLRTMVSVLSLAAKQDTFHGFVGSNFGLLRLLSSQPLVLWISKGSPKIFNFLISQQMTRFRLKTIFVTQHQTLKAVWSLEDSRPCFPLTIFPISRMTAKGDQEWSRMIESDKTLLSLSLSKFPASASRHTLESSLLNHPIILKAILCIETDKPANYEFKIKSDREKS